MLTRVCTPELPYLCAFLGHHASLGVHFFHLLYQEEALTIPLRQLARELGVNVQLHTAPSDRTPAQVLKESHLEFETEYALLLDPDEFVFLPGKADLSLFLASLNQPASCYLRWVVAPCDFQPASRGMGYLGHIGKHLAQSTRIAGIATAHTFALLQQEPISPFQFERHDGFIIHYWGRTFIDTVLKCLYYKGVHPSKQSSIEEVKSCSDPSTLPKRLKLLAALNLHHRYISTPDHLANKIDLQKEEELLHAHLSTAQFDRLKTAYLEYRDFLDNSSNTAAQAAIQSYPGNSSIQKLESLLPVWPYR